ncbi:MAG: glycosyltransferase [Burkholderiales bacterium]
MTETKLPPEIGSWLETFKKKHGRSPRVLHIGNIANNAYNNAKMLNNAGVDCDVICYDYYHIMGCPEWEDADYRGEISDQLFPDWKTVDLNGFERPRWFAQGPSTLCIDYLIAKRDGNMRAAAKLWRKLGKPEPSQSRRRAFWEHTTHLKRVLQNLQKPVQSRIDGWRYLWYPFGSLLYHIYKVAEELLSIAILLALAPVILAINLRTLIAFVAAHLRYKRRAMEPKSGEDISLTENGQSEIHNFAARAKRFVEIFAENFRQRADPLTPADLEHYRHYIPRWKALFDRYDLIQAYSTDTALPLVAGKRPYIGFEHGTLRIVLTEQGFVWRLALLGYNQADHVFITNGDSLAYAADIGIKRFTPMLHPIQEERVRSVQGDYRKLHETCGVKHIFLCTLRHDWAIKGTDKYIRALPKLKELLGADQFLVLMTTWGAQVDESRQLADDLGVTEQIKWITPLPKVKLIRMQKSVDVLFDQIALPHFGATAPEAIASGVPVIMSYDPKSTEWIIPEPAPILSAWTVDEIVANVQLALDPQWLAGYRVRGAMWIDNYHNDGVILRRHLDVYRSLLPVS